jgi:hypothetical protein
MQVFVSSMSFLFFNIYFSQLITGSKCVVNGSFAMISQSGVVFVYHNIPISIIRTHRLFEVNIQSHALRIIGVRLY